MKISEYIDKASSELISGAVKAEGNLPLNSHGDNRVTMPDSARFTIQLDSKGEVAESADKSVCQVEISLYL